MLARLTPTCVCNAAVSPGELSASTEEASSRDRIDHGSVFEASNDGSTGHSAYRDRRRLEFEQDRQPSQAKTASGPSPFGVCTRGAFPFCWTNSAPRCW